MNIISDSNIVFAMKVARHKMTWWNKLIYKIRLWFLQRKKFDKELINKISKRVSDKIDNEILQQMNFSGWI